MADSWDAFPIVSQPTSQPTVAPAATDWSQYPAMPDQPAMSWGDWARAGTTAGVRGLGGLANAVWDPYGTLMAPFRTIISPEEEKRYQAGETPGPGTKLGDAFFRWTGIPEYQPTTPPGRVAMSTAQGAVAGAPLGATGALISGLSGLLGQTTQEATGNERLAAAASLVPAGVAGVRAATAPAPRAEVPTAGELQARGSAGFDASRASPVEVARTPLQQLTRAAEGEVYQRYDPEMMPQTQRMIQTRIMQGGSLDFNDIQNLRGALNQIISDNASTATKAGNAHEVAGASAILRSLDEHIADLPNNPQHVTTGTPAEVSDVTQTYQDARANYAAAMRSNKIGGGLRDEGTGGSIMGAAQNRVEAANSGRNYDNILRSQVRQFMEKDSNRAGFSPEELAALDAARRGSFVQNRLRDVSNMLGGGPSLTSLASGGVGGAAGSAFGPLGAAAGAAIPPALGMIARNIENYLARQRITAADEAVRMRSPLYQQNNLNQALAPRDMAVIRSLLPGLLAPPQSQPNGPGLLFPNSG